MRPIDWRQALAPAVPDSLANATVEREVRRILAAAKPGEHFGTTALAAVLYPPEHARGDEGQAARKRLFSVLRWLAKHELADHATPGAIEVRRYFGRERAVRPLLWHAPAKPVTPGTCCPHCGKEIAP